MAEQPSAKPPDVSRAAFTLWLLFIFDAVLLTAFLQVMGASGRATIARPIRRFLAATQEWDSWRVMQAAQEYLTTPHDRPVYDAMLNAKGIKFQYPLSSLLLTRHFSFASLNVISWFSIVIVVVAVWLILRRSSTGTPLEFRRGDTLAGLAIVGVSLSFFPLMEAYSLGQIQAWINALLALAILAWLTKREDLAGVAVGLACLMKPTYLLFGVWAVVRRQTRFLLPMAGVVFLGTLAAIAAYSLADNLDYLHALRTMGGRGEAFYPNQSVNGVLNRLLGNGDSLKFDRSAFAPFHPIVAVGTVAFFAVCMSLAIWIPARLRAAGRTGDFAIALLTITMTSPIAWTHHYGVLLPILAATAPSMLAGKPLGRWTGAVLAACYVLASQSIPFTNRLAGTPFGILQSYLFVSSLVILAMIYGSLSPQSGPASLLEQKRGDGVQVMAPDRPLMPPFSLYERVRDTVLLKRLREGTVPWSGERVVLANADPKQL